MITGKPQHEWSNGLRDETRKALFDLSPSPDGRIHMKHIDGGFGSFELLDLLKGRFILRLKGNAGEQTFANAEEVISAGWAVD